jgi:hypothetical protein
LLCLLVLLATTSQAQITPSSDSYTSTAAATTNYGASTLLGVDGATVVTYLQFNLASIPTTASISQATLKLYVNSVTIAGSFNVDYVKAGWEESTIDASNAPPLGSTIASEVAITTADKNQYILINVTSAVQAWLSGSETNNGIALVANGEFYATFDSKENTTTSHPPELDIAFAGGDGTITGVTTASGSGLSGGGTSGTLSLGLTNACAASQVLQWNGSTWTCSSAGTGTITGVTAGTDLTGGGTSGKVTLNVDTTKVPLLNTANTFTANQGVMGNVTVSGKLGIGTTTPSQALDMGTNNNMVIRVDPGNDTTQADGGYSLVGRGAGGVPNTWWTQTAPVGGGFGVPANSYSIWQYPPNATPGCCLNRFTILPAEASTDTGGTVQIDQSGNASQPLAAGGFVKAMVFVDPGSGVLECFNSTFSGAAATTPPCGFRFINDLAEGDTIIDFGFQVDNRFPLVNPGFGNASSGGISVVGNACTDADGACNHNPTSNQVEVLTQEYAYPCNVICWTSIDVRYWLIIY